jgi:hypothetical protein
MSVATAVECHERSLASSATYSHLLGNSLKQTNSDRLNHCAGVHLMLFDRIDASGADTKEP